MTIPMVELNNVTKIYRQKTVEVRAVNGVSFVLERGEFTALCGPSGSGKTTLLNLIGALDAPTGGEVYLEGANLTRLTRTERSRMRRDRMGFIFQSYNLIPVLTAYENAEFVLTLQGIPIEKRRPHIFSLLKAVGLEGLEDRRPNDLSGGQQQRVAIARAIAGNPAIILADEPTANVDSKTAEGLLDLMEQLNREKKTTFLFSTHDPRVMKRARRIISLQDGKVVSDEEPVC
jgi:putative ABC transport system ATP-binding protein